MKIQKISLLVTIYCTVVFAQDIPFKEIAKVKPRHAKEIKSSNWSIGCEVMDRDYTIFENWKKYLGPLGAKKARIQSGWAKTEKEKGVYDWAWLDEIVNGIVEQGVEPWMCICYGNPIYQGQKATDLGAKIPETPEELDAWERYVAAVIERYKSQIDEWEVWNEPHDKDGYIYIPFYIRTAETIRKIQPESTIMWAMFQNNLKPGLEALKKANKLHLIDEITNHPYDQDPYRAYNRIEKLRKLIAEYSPKIVLFDGETGCPAYGGGQGALSEYDWNEESQAKWAVVRLLGDLGHDMRVSYFTICDYSYVNRDFKGKACPFGLLAANLNKEVTKVRPVYYAMQHVTSIFDDTLTRIKDIQIKIKEPGHPKRGYATFAYTSENQDKIVTLWRYHWVKNVGYPGEKTDLEYLKVDLPEITFKEPVYVDMVSGKIYEFSKENWENKEGGSVFRKLPIYDSVILIAEKALIPSVQ